MWGGCGLVPRPWQVHRRVVECVGVRGSVFSRPCSSQCLVGDAKHGARARLMKRATVFTSPPWLVFILKQAKCYLRDERALFCYCFLDKVLARYFVLLLRECSLGRQFWRLIIHIPHIVLNKSIECKVREENNY